MSASPSNEHDHPDGPVGYQVDDGLHHEATAVGQVQNDSNSLNSGSAPLSQAAAEQANYTRLSGSAHSIEEEPTAQAAQITVSDSSTVLVETPRRPEDQSPPSSTLLRVDLAPAAPIASAPTSFSHLAPSRPLSPHSEAGTAWESLYEEAASGASADPGHPTPRATPIAKELEPEPLSLNTAHDNHVWVDRPSGSSSPPARSDEGPQEQQRPGRNFGEEPSRPQTPTGSGGTNRVDRLLHTSEGYVPASPVAPKTTALPLSASPAASSSSKPAPAARALSPTRKVAWDPATSSSADSAPRRIRRNRVGRPSLHDTVEDLRALLQSLRRVLPLGGRVSRHLPKLVLNLFRSAVRQAAIMLHRRNLLASNIAYDIAMLIFKLIINLFFREIRPRGSHRIPDEGPIIFVAAPHHNQFLDPLLLMSEVRAASSRRISFLIAEKSMKRAFVGLMARFMQSISVVRAADDAKPGRGIIYLPPAFSLGSTKPGDCTVVLGLGTAFTSELAPRRQLMLSKSLNFATVEVVEVISDTECKVKKGFGSKAGEALSKAGEASDGLQYKVLPHIDQTRMYSKVYDKLKGGGCLGIFPEGGSHDRTDLLPLKAGVSIMALGAMSANPDVKVQIVPVGLSYFHPHRFRSRAVVEFGSPIEIPQSLVKDFEKGSEDKRVAIGKVMELVYDGLKSVTVRAPDYETLQVIQAARRLYRPPDQHLSLGQVVELNKRFITGYLKYEQEPKVQALKAKVLEYNQALRHLGLKDHQVEKADRPWWKSLVLMIFRAGLVTGWGVLALPGLVLNAPMFGAARLISRRKAKEALAASTVKIAGRDVLATWKVLVSLGIAPPLYIIYCAIATYFAVKYRVPRKYVYYLPVAMMIALPSIGYSALKFGEVGMDVYKSLRPLFLSVTGNHRQLERLRQQRIDLAEELHVVIEEFAPQIWDDFDKQRIVQHPAASPIDRHRRQRSGYSGSDIINHPLAWLDERLFGWSQYDAPVSRAARIGSVVSDGDSDGAGSATQSGYTTETNEGEEDGDFDSVVGMLGHVMGHQPGSRPRSRLSSRGSRSRSALDLTKADGQSNGAKATGVQAPPDGDVRQR